LRAVLVLQCFDTLGWALQPVKIVPEMTYYVSDGTLIPTHLPCGRFDSKEQDGRVKSLTETADETGRDKRRLGET